MTELVARLGKDKVVLGKNISLGRKNNAGQIFRSAAVVGAAGQIGEVFTRNLVSIAHIEAVVRERRWRDETAHPQVRFHADIERMLETEPEVVILATPNPADKALEKIARHVQKPLILILPQNGVDVVEKAKQVLSASESQITIIRASLYTNVSRDRDGNILYNPNKNRIALAPVGHDQDDSLIKAKNTLAQAGFDVKVMQDYHSMEWSKLIGNLLGSTSTVTDLSPREAFSDPEIFALELRALKDRLRILEAAGIKVADLWNIGKLRWLAKVPEPIAATFRGAIAHMVAQERNNQPPAAARQINKGARIVESADYCHQPFVHLGKEHGLESPVDEAILDILRRHGRTNNDFSLTALEADERRKLLLEIFGYETKQVFIRGFFPLRLAVDRLYEHYLDNFKILGRENLTAVAQTLNQGKSVVIAPNHRSHTDHVTVIKALREALPQEARKYPVYIVAGMKFDQEMISGTLNHSYPHPVVCTLGEGDGEEARWKAHIINRRAGTIIDRLLEKPCIFILYLEGGRSKIIKDGEVQLQKAAPGGSSWLLDSRFGLVVPTVITGTEKMLPPGRQLLRHADVTIEFCDAIETDWLRKQGAAVSRKDGDRDRYLSGIVFGTIAAKLPPSARGSYGY